MLSLRRIAAGAAAVVVAVGGLQLFSQLASADPSGDALVINEVYGGGGNAGAPYSNDFVELFNPTGSPVAVDGWAVQYFSATGGSGGTIPLTGSVPAHGHYLVQGGAGTSPASALPAPDATGTINMSATAGRVVLTKTSTPLGALPAGTITPGATGVENVVDFVGFGPDAASYEGAAPASAPSNTTSIARNATHVDTNDNGADFTAGGPTPANSSDVESTELTATDPGDRSYPVGAAIPPLTLTASGGTAPYTFTTTALPAGLSLSGTEITGTPTTIGTTTVTVTATDAAAATATSEFVIDVFDAAAPTPIAEIQGTGAASPLVGQTRTVEAVVTAIYRTGGFNGFYIQTPGPDTPDASDAIFVYAGSPQNIPAGLDIGDSVRVTGTIGEFNGLTQISPQAGGVAEITSLGTVMPKAVIPGTDCELPGTSCLTGSALEAAREAAEGELFRPTASYTVTDVYDGSAFNPPNSGSSSFFGEIGLAANSTEPLVTPTEVIDAQATADIQARVAYNNAHRVVLDDGSSTTYWNTANTAGGMNTPFPWFTPTNQVRVGAAVTFNEPVVLDYRFGWKVQPTSQVADDGADSVSFEQNRPAAPAAVGGDVKLATFNVLNYFTTLGVDYGGCTSYNDREGNPIAVNQCPGNGPRGAWNEASFLRQQAKIVNAINALDADVVSLEEIENSLVVDGHDRDEAVAALVTALNASAGPGTWDYVRSPVSASDPANASQDVIRTGFIYKPATVEVVGDADMLFGIPAFDNAREPFAAVFRPVGGAANSRFAVIANHFKSKGSGVDDGTGQGNANPDRTAQAEALRAYAEQFSTDRDVAAVFLTGDFNAYSQEDPIQVLSGAGYQPLVAEGKYSYSFDGQSGSLDHVLANPAAAAMSAGVDIWEINANETVFQQYSRYNYNAANLYADAAYSASDHNPAVVGIAAPASDTTDIQILSTNDFHGRISPNGAEAGAAKLAGVVAALRAQNPNTSFVSPGDLIGGSTFESFIQQDKPTIDVLNAAGLEVSAVGNHELDQGYDDLINRVMADGGAQWEYIAANLRRRGTGDPAVPPSWTKTMDGVEVGFVGAVTEDLPSLVSPDGISEIEVTDIVDSVNAEAAALRARGADIVVALVHEGATSTDCTSPSFTDAGTTFGNIAQNTSADVDAIVSAHTHLTYNCTINDRPVVSAGQYGTNLNQLVFTYDKNTAKVTAVTQVIIPIAQHEAPADPDVAQIVADAVAQADVLGAQVLGQIAAPFNRAKLADGTTENRGGESTLSNLVAEVQRWATEKPESGAAQIAFMNPGGLRADMGGTVNGGARDLTYKQAAVVQPFANTLVNMDLTGAMIKEVLEQQWQRDAAGAVPSRPFLRLGVSKGFTYTFDPARPEGDRITGMWLDGTAIDSTATYSVTVNSFLASGGDNFRAFTKGTGRADTGKIDLSAMVDYLAAHAKDAPLQVDYSQRAVGVGFPADAPAGYRPGDTVRFDVSSWTMSTADDIKDTDVQVKLGDTVLGSVTLDNTIGTAVFDYYGTATVSVVLPENLAPGAVELTLVGVATGTKVPVPVTVVEREPTNPGNPGNPGDPGDPGNPGGPTATTVVVGAVRQTYGRTVGVTVNVSPNATGRVSTTVGGRTVTRHLTNGAAVLTLPAKSLRPGRHTLTIAYLPGSTSFAPSSARVTVTVVKAGAKVTVKPIGVVRRGAVARFRVTVSAQGVRPTGAVTVRFAGRTGIVRLSAKGQAIVPIAVPRSVKVGMRTVQVSYGGDAYVAKAVAPAIKVRVSR